MQDAEGMDILGGVVAIVPLAVRPACAVWLVKKLPVVDVVGRASVAGDEGIHELGEVGKVGLVYGAAIVWAGPSRALVNYQDRSEVVGGYTAEDAVVVGPTIVGRVG